MRLDSALSFCLIYFADSGRMWPHSVCVLRWLKKMRVLFCFFASLVIVKWRSWSITSSRLNLTLTGWSRLPLSLFYPSMFSLLDSLRRFLFFHRLIIFSFSSVYLFFLRISLQIRPCSYFGHTRLFGGLLTSICTHLDPPLYLPSSCVCLLLSFTCSWIPKRNETAAPQSCEQKGQVEREETPSFKLAMLQRSVSGPDSVIA